jgi:hypothetical protein
VLGGYINTILEVIHSPLPSDIVKNEWSYTVTLPPCFHWVERNRFRFLNLVTWVLCVLNVVELLRKLVVTQLVK